MERKVGEIFNANGTILQVCEVKESDGCNGCFFEELHPRCLPYICAAQEREDGKNVQFKEIRKTMTREEAKRRAELYSALADGKAIQVQNPVTSKWEYLKINKIGEFNEELNYRIKPEDTYRPFETKEECWNEMHKHPDFGWVKEISCEMLYLINGISNESIVIMEDINSFKEAMNIYEFKDGTPFGIKEE